MFINFWYGVQQDLKIFLLAPVFCAIFRLLFIWGYGLEKVPSAKSWKKWMYCFRYGFWWGLDWNAYVFLVSMVLVSLPGVFIPAYYEIGDDLRVGGIAAYLVVVYTAFVGKCIFYHHFHDTFNQTLRLGRNADKKNLIDIFLHQHNGIFILLSYIPYVLMILSLSKELMLLPPLPYVSFDNVFLQYAVNAFVFIGCVVLFYWLRYGGHISHRKKPEWDEEPEVLKKDKFFSKAAMDDLIALELAIKTPLIDVLSHDDAKGAEIMQPLLGKRLGKGEAPWKFFKRKTAGKRLKNPPKHIFLLLGESHMQAAFDPIAKPLHLMEGSEAFRAEPGTLAFDNFLPGGMRSRPSLVSLLLGVYDGDLEINERIPFWEGSIPLAWPQQFKRLGYESDFWYGGGLGHGSLEHFLPPLGFERMESGLDICGSKARRTWLGVFDHLFLEKAAKIICERDKGQKQLHVLYTTSFHGPFRLPVAELGFDIDRLMPEIPEKIRRDRGLLYRQWGTAWYADQALMNFIKEMKAVFPDSLFIVTGDHSAGILPYGTWPKRDANLREGLLTSFAISHPELKWEMLANNTIGCHMNIMPTLMELVAPEGFEYYSLAAPLTEKIDHIVTPYCWMTEEMLGDYRCNTAQQLRPDVQSLELKQEVDKFRNERDALVELTGWLVRHPELLDKASS